VHNVLKVVTRPLASLLSLCRCFSAVALDAYTMQNEKRLLRGIKSVSFGAASLKCTIHVGRSKEEPFQPK